MRRQQQQRQQQHYGFLLCLLLLLLLLFVTTSASECSTTSNHECPAILVEEKQHQSNTNAATTTTTTTDITNASKATATQQHQHQQQQQDTTTTTTTTTTTSTTTTPSSVCSLYLAPSSIPNAGWGVYTSVPLKKNQMVDRDIVSVPIEDHFKTMPFRGKERFKLWLGYVWPRRVNEFSYSSTDAFPMIPSYAYYDAVDNKGLTLSNKNRLLVANTNDNDDDNDDNDDNTNELQYQSTFRPGLMSLLNSHLEHQNIKIMNNQRMKTSQDVPAGSELFQNYGKLWHQHNQRLELERIADASSTPHQQTLEFYNQRMDWTDLPTQDEKYQSIDPVTLHKRFGERGIAQKEHPETTTTTAPKVTRSLVEDPVQRSSEWLQEYGYCLNRIGVQVVKNNNNNKKKKKKESSDTTTTTTTPVVVVVVAKTALTKGNVITTSPVLAIPRDDLNIYELYEKETKLSSGKHTNHQQQPSASSYALNFTKGAIAVEPLLEYTHGDERSDLLLLPYGPYVHLFQSSSSSSSSNDNNINNNNNNVEPNAVIRFSTTDPVTQELLKLHPLSVMNSTSKLLVDFVALQDISPGEPIVLEYGPAFQHERTVPDDLYPAHWLNTPVEYIIQDVKKPLQPGELQQLVWQHNQEPVTTHAYRLGLEPGFSQKLLEYSQDLGIVDIYKRLLNDDILESDDWYVFNATTPAGQEHQEWFAQRYKSKSWSFNMHYIAAWSESARVSFLRGLNQAGFGNALESLGTQLEGVVDELTCFHVSYMGVSHCENSMMHTDVYATDWKGFNILFPIQVVDGSKEELDIQARDANVVTSVHYECDHAIVMGDWGYHKTSPNSFENDEIRIVVGMYCAEMTPDNMNQLAHIYNGEDPAPFMNQFTNYDEREVHWSRKGGANLPE